VLILIRVSMLSGAADADTMSAQDEFLVGQKLFVGKIDLHGRIRTHVVDLPPEVVRCANCHAVAEGADVPRTLAPRLTRELLVQPHPRRGGPASAYDRDSFCALLQKGFDPAYIIISIEMPRYAIDATSCAALWRFLTWNSNEPDAH
jgi:hypothetical protein